MQELAQAVERAAEGAHLDEAAGGPLVLDTAAQEWAAHALATYQGALLKRALRISAALADFTAELAGGK